MAQSAILLNSHIVFCDKLQQSGSVAGKLLKQNIRPSTCIFIERIKKTVLVILYSNLLVCTFTKTFTLYKKMMFLIF